MSSREEHISDLLMAAAHADGHLDGRELQRVRQILRQATKAAFLPEALRVRMRAFEPEALNLAATIEALGLSDPADKRQLVELIASVHEADSTWDLDEDEYLRSVAVALGMAKSDYADLTIEEIHIEEIGARLLPPPLPPAGSE